MSIERMAVDGRVQAWMLRQLGIKVPDSIPDVAGTDLDKIIISKDKIKTGEDGCSMIMSCEVQTDKFEWIKIDVTLKPKYVN